MKSFTKILIILTLLFSQFAFAQTAIVFILGKGPASRDAEYYWGDDMIQTITHQESLPKLLVNYDGGLGMKDATETVSQQIHDFIKNQNREDLELKVVTHSYGGVVIRSIVCRYLEEEIYDEIAKKISTIFAIAAPNGGSQAADMAYNLKGKLILADVVEALGHNSNATFDLTTSRMKEINDNVLCGTAHRPPLPYGIEYFTVIGTKALNNWYSEVDVALKLLAELSDLPKPNDGMVAQVSGEIVGKPFSKVSTTIANHNNNRRNKIGKFAAEIASTY